MDFPTRIMKSNQITIPKSVREYMDLHVGDLVMITVTKKETVEHHKAVLESRWAALDRGPAEVTLVKP